MGFSAAFRLETSWRSSLAASESGIGVNDPRQLQTFFRNCLLWVGVGFFFNHRCQGRSSHFLLEFQGRIVVLEIVALERRNAGDRGCFKNLMAFELPLQRSGPQPSGATKACVRCILLPRIPPRPQIPQVPQVPLRTTRSPVAPVATQ